jgi:heat-inducible transcriptional repressor
MTAKTTGGLTGGALDERQAAVLMAIIRSHIRTGEPVGSLTAARGAGLTLSPASIRSIMAELEESGLLSQPHTSAGRVPTDRAYRVYVDEMIGEPQVVATQASSIERALRGRQGEVAELLNEASRQLSLFSNQVGLVLAPDLSRTVVEHLEFVRLDEARVVAILVSRSGLVHNRILQVERAPDQQELERVGRYLSDEFRGLTLPEIRDALRQRLWVERAAYDRLTAASLELGRRAVEAEGPGAEIFVEGASNLLMLPEFADPGALRGLFRALEEKSLLIDLLSQMLEGGGVRVVIGEENPLSDLARCSLVASSYGSPERPMGTVGIVGPTRMRYSRAIALVDYLARVLTRLLSNTEN